GLLLALGAKDHHQLMALTSRTGAGICWRLHRSSSAWPWHCREEPEINLPEPWNKLSPTDQYKFLAVSTDYKNLKKERPSF
uniref:Uncharacterized protein n=1 Tax=Malurus cyaneus samueli TaxID=2593467 RepID=A0A8C5U9I7_9PASS